MVRLFITGSREIRMLKGLRCSTWALMAEAVDARRKMKTSRMRRTNAGTGISAWRVLVKGVGATVGLSQVLCT
jgi:hypothetical protein